MSNSMDDLEDLVPPEFECAADAYYEDDEEYGAVCLYADRLAPDWDSHTAVHYIPSYPSYTIKLKGHFIRLGFDNTYIEYTDKNGLRKHFIIESPLKLSDFVKIVKTPFPLDLSEGYMRNLHDDEFNGDEFNVKNVVLEVDNEFVKQQIHRFVNLLLFL